jgi:hypothetical protein
MANDSGLRNGADPTSRSHFVVDHETIQRTESLEQTTRSSLTTSPEAIKKSSHNSSEAASGFLTGLLFDPVKGLTCNSKLKRCGSD